MFSWLPVHAGQPVAGSSLCRFLCRARTRGCPDGAGFMFMDDPQAHRQGTVAAVFHS